MKKGLLVGGALIAMIAISGALVGSPEKTPVKSAAPDAVQSAPVSEVEAAAPATELESQPATPTPAPTPAPAPAADCKPGYDPCIPNVSYDLDCADIGHSVRVTGSDPFRLDRDNDGYGCESY